MHLQDFVPTVLTEGQKLDLTKNWPGYNRVVGEIVGSRGSKYLIKIVTADGTGKLSVGDTITIAPNYVKRMPVVAESNDTVWMGKLAKTGKIVRIVRKQHEVKFSNERDWLLVDTDPAKGNRGDGLKWIPAATEFTWIRPYKKTIDEDTGNTESRNNKFDHFLTILCQLIIQGQKINSDLGMVAACVIDNDNRAVFGINYPDGEGKRVHAERAAIENYTKQYGEIPTGSVIVTTLSPCTDSEMHERHGDSCSDLISHTDVDKVYCGYQDPSQQDTDRDYNLMVTDNVQLRSLCKDFADTFLKENFSAIAESAESRLPRSIEQFLYSLTPSDVGVEEIGPYRIHFEGFTDDCKSSSDYCADPDAVYQEVFDDFVQREGGSKPVASGMIGDEDYPVLYSVFLKQMDENFADGKKPGRKGLAKRVGVNCKQSISKLRSIAAHSSGERQRMAHWCANMKAGKKK